MPAAQPGGAFKHHKHVQVMNVVVGGLCWGIVTKHLTYYVWRCTSAWRMGKCW